MFMALLKFMLVVFMLAGIAGILYGVYEVWRTVAFVSASTGRTTGTFLGYHRELHRSTSIRSWSPANPKMPSTTQSHAVATYPEFVYTTSHGDEEVVREEKVHVFSIYKGGEEVDVLLSSSAQPRLAGFYSLYFRDLLILVMGLMALSLALVFWNHALPLVTTPHPTTLQEGEASPGADGGQVQDTTTIEQAFDGILQEALEFRVGPIKMRHILWGALGMVLLVIILSFFGGSGKP